MQIKQQELFKNQFKVIFENIAKDKVSAAKKFKKDLFTVIKNIPNMPYKYRKSYYSADEKVRDMIFRGYTIVYKIYENYIVIVEIFNTNLPKTKYK